MIDSAHDGIDLLLCCHLRVAQHRSHYFVAHKPDPRSDQFLLVIFGPGVLPRAPMVPMAPGRPSEAGESRKTMSQCVSLQLEPAEAHSLPFFTSVSVKRLQMGAPLVPSSPSEASVSQSSASESELPAFRHR
jgi:hypothetical protein